MTQKFKNFPEWVWSIPAYFNIGAACSDKHLGTAQADNIAMIVEDDVLGTAQITFTELAHKTDQFAQLLRNLKVKVGDRVLIRLPNSLDYPIAFLGAMKMGAIAVPTSTLLTAEEVVYLAKDSGASVLVTDAKAWVAMEEGFCINLGHEVGHKNTRLERWLAKFILAPTGYGHFTVEHNRGHHRDVATPADPASSRMGESIYRFLMREMPGALVRAWALEKARLRLNNLPIWSLHNEVLQPAVITVLLWGTLIAWLGVHIVPFLLVASFWGNFQLTSANYIEHYGLLRKERSPGKYEPCQPYHSWNSNHIFSNWALFHLQRHSDHHAHPLRRYQSLRHFDSLPRLPSGYFGMFSIAYVPPLWRYVMDERLLNTVGRHAANINLDPRHREALIKRYGLTVTP